MAIRLGDRREVRAGDKKLGLRDPECKAMILDEPAEGVRAGRRASALRPTPRHSQVRVGEMGGHLERR